MNPGLALPQEIIGFRRSAATPGIEIVDAQDSPREWRVVCPTFAVVVFSTWSGPVHFAGRTHQGKPGVVFCNVPSEPMVSRPDGDRPGSFNVIESPPRSCASGWPSNVAPPLASRGSRPCSQFQPS
ncbi:MAG: hypothetical protein ABUL62_09015 [Myxococcales bacterium]